MGNMKELLHEVPDDSDLNADYAPKRIKLARILRVRIQRGDFKNGQYLGRIELAAEYGVSPNTVFYALSALSVNGYVEAERYDFPKRIGYRFQITYPQQARTVPNGTG
jgi:DNA-binding transcriptional MocR family regulator